MVIISLREREWDGSKRSFFLLQGSEVCSKCAKNSLQKLSSSQKIDIISSSINVFSFDRYFVWRLYYIKKIHLWNFYFYRTHVIINTFYPTNLITSRRSRINNLCISFRISNNHNSICSINSSIFCL